jgi:hypothetical protein
MGFGIARPDPDRLPAGANCRFKLTLLAVQRAQRRVSLRPVWFNPNGLPIRYNGFSTLALRAERMAKVVMGFGRIGLDLHRLRKRGSRLLKLP